MIYRGYEIQVPFPPGSGDVQVRKSAGPDSGQLVKTFPYSTPDEVVMDWIDREKKGLNSGA